MNIIYIIVATSMLTFILTIQTYLYFSRKEILEWELVFTVFLLALTWPVMIPFIIMMIGSYYLITWIGRLLSSLRDILNPIETNKG
jgi:hypothetical protein